MNSFLSFFKGLWNWASKAETASSGVEMYSAQQQLKNACEAYAGDRSSASLEALRAAIDRLKSVGVDFADPSWIPFFNFFPKSFKAMPERERELDRLMDQLRTPGFDPFVYEAFCKGPYEEVRFDPAQHALPYHADPLILDLDGDGLETVSVAAGILFDHDGDGLRTGTGWVGRDDGFLVMDRNGNGRIDNGAELFGDATPLDAGGRAADDFAALAQEDTNGDGKVSSLDARWHQLRIWQDANQDGISQIRRTAT